jgi:DNA-binding NarL/FixJ family response regulator
MRVLIIEDEIIIGRFIQQLVHKNLDCETSLVISSEEAKTEMPLFLPHLVLSDINLKAESDGIELVRALQASYHFETIFITSYRTHGVVEKATLTSPANYIVKPIDETQFAISIKLVESRLLNMPLAGKPRENIASKLTKTEYKILQLISNNLTTNDISMRLFISVSTVRNHRHNISQKLELSNDNNSLVKWALENKAMI